MWAARGNSLSVRLPFNCYCYFGAVRLHPDIAVRYVTIDGSQPPATRRLVPTINPKTFLFEPFLRRPHIRRQRTQLRLEFFHPIIGICRHLGQSFSMKLNTKMCHPDELTRVLIRPKHAKVALGCASRPLGARSACQLISAAESTARLCSQYLVFWAARFQARQRLMELHRAADAEDYRPEDGTCRGGDRETG